MNYEQIFAQRGSAYDRAMQRWPEARCDDFRVPLAVLDPQPGEVIVDVPAGGGYLSRYLPAACRWVGHEPCASFHGDQPGQETDLLPLPWPDGFADAAISIAGVHHLDDKGPVFRELRRVVSGAGRFVLADVHVESPVRGFLDDFVGSHNSTGHAGVYLDTRTLQELEASGWQVDSAERIAFCWWFADRGNLAEFCRMFFDMPGLDDETLIAGVERHLGLCTRAGAIGMNWELFVVRAH
jgi:SAM-dependent methyltransferase